jgi:uncharacterized protein YdeI (YjbR/CyaY-like superfamily)
LKLRAQSARKVRDPIFFATPAEFRRWLEANHARADELQVGFHKRGSGKPSLTWPEAVDEALCFGWIDGVRRGHDDTSYTIRFTPRRPGSHWSAVNVAKAQALIAAGRMRPAGRRAFEQRRADRTAQASYERADPPQLTPEQEQEFRASERAWAFFSDQPPWYRRTALHWVTSAKRPETRDRRLQRLIEASANQSRAF